jgi:hypothetical protein
VRQLESPFDLSHMQKQINFAVHISGQLTHNLHLSKSLLQVDVLEISEIPELIVSIVDVYSFCIQVGSHLVI